MNSVMTKQQCTKVYFRVLPMEKMTWDYIKILDDEQTIYIRALQTLSKSSQQAVPTFWTFRSDHVFYNHNQTSIYETVIPDVLDSISQGQDAIIMSYGQTGTGKSLTINGLYNTFEERGILPRLASDLFHRVKKDAAKKQIKMSIQVSYVEFSKTAVYDLLKPYPNNVSSLKNIAKLKLTSFEETLKLIFTGEGRKLYCENVSYPSHLCSCIFTFYVSAKRLDMQDDLVHRSKIHVIDLAGADTVGNFTCLFKQAQDVAAANLAKTQLEQFFITLCTDIPEFINTKRRISPMIHYLGDSMRKTSLFRLLGHIRVSKEDLLISISMLRFGQLLGGLKITKYQMHVVQYQQLSQSRLDTLEKELAKLKLENKNNQNFMQQDLAKSLNEERMAHIERTVNEYLQNKITQVTLTTVCDVNIALEMLKMFYKKCEEERTNVERDSVSKKSATNLSKQQSQHRTSRGSNKSAHSDASKKKMSEDKTGEKSRPSGGNADVKTKIHGSSQKLKRSSSSLLKRSTTSKRKSGSSVSLTRTKSKSKTFEESFMPEIPPEYSEAWATYVYEKNEEYSRLLEAYKKNEAALKASYKSYLWEVERLKHIVNEVEKTRNDLFLAKLTTEFKHIGADRDVSFSDFQKCCMEKLQKAEEEKLLKQECVLKCQSEVKAHFNVCNNMKKDLSDSFYAFCKEKYHAPVMNLESEELVAVDALECLEKVEPIFDDSQEIIAEDPESVLFENLKPLIKIGKRNRKIYLMKHKEWMTY